MNSLKNYAEGFKLKYEMFINGCDAVEESGVWDKEQYGEMEQYFNVDFIAVTLRLIAADSWLTEIEADFLNELFEFDYTVEELNEVYTNCKDTVDAVSVDFLRESYDMLEKIDVDAAEAYKAIITDICDIVIQCDGDVSKTEAGLAFELKSF